MKITGSFVTGVALARVPKRPQSWMDKLADSEKISKINIPGTHETCALHSESLITCYSVCQNRTLKEQLEAGIRFIDIRCRHIENVFAIYHYPVSQKINFGTGVRDIGINFLKANPSEFIVMSIKREYDDANNTRQFQDTFDWYIKGNEEFWYLDNRIPTIKEVRGKIVLLRRFTGNKGIAPLPWADNATFDVVKNGGTFKIQDEYTVSPLFPLNMSKWNKIKNLLDLAQSDTSDNWYINFSSGSNIPFAAPILVANEINPKLLNYLDDGNFSNRLGTFAMDFPDNMMINRIISLNK